MATNDAAARPRQITGPNLGLSATVPGIAGTNPVESSGNPVRDGIGAGKHEADPVRDEELLANSEACLALKGADPRRAEVEPEIPGWTS